MTFSELNFNLIIRLSARKCFDTDRKVKLEYQIIRIYKSKKIMNKG